MQVLPFVTAVNPLSVRDAGVLVRRNPALTKHGHSPGADQPIITVLAEQVQALMNADSAHDDGSNRAAGTPWTTTWTDTAG